METKYLWQLSEKDKPEKRVALIIPDTHLCYELENALEFLVHTAIEKGVTDIYHVGDLIDSATVNMHGYDPNGLSPTHELEKTKEHIQRWGEVFPKMKISIGNHFTAATRKGKKHGIPKIYLKTVPQLFEYPSGWDVAERHEFKNVVIEHGMRFGGASGAVNTAKNNLKSSCIGHLHQQMSITYFNNGEKQLFGMSVGTLVDDTQIAFTYAKHAKHRSALGCGIVYSDEHAEVVPYSKHKNYGVVETSKPVIKKKKVSEFVIRRAVSPKKTNSSHSAGNLKGTKHRGHMSKYEQIYAKFPNGDIVSFDTVEECKEEVRIRNPKYKTSGLTNISTYARQDKSIYGVAFTYDTSIANRWIKGVKKHESK